MEIYKECIVKYICNYLKEFLQSEHYLVQIHSKILYLILLRDHYTIGWDISADLWLQGWKWHEKIWFHSREFSSELTDFFMQFDSLSEVRLNRAGVKIMWPLYYPFNICYFYMCLYTKLGYNYLLSSLACICIILASALLSDWYWCLVTRILQIKMLN